MWTVMAGKSMTGHHRPHRGHTDDWLTPPDIVRALGPFDTDPCCPRSIPWRTADRMYDRVANGLSKDWVGAVWLNPPYGPDVEVWLGRLAEHGDGICLVMSRTETRWFFERVWEAATAVLFMKGRIHFHHIDGTRAKANAGCGTVLAAYGERCAERLERCGIPGQFIRLKPKSAGPWPFHVSQQQPVC